MIDALIAGMVLFSVALFATFRWWWMNRLWWLAAREIDRRTEELADMRAAVDAARAVIKLCEALQERRAQLDYWALHKWTVRSFYPELYR